MYGELCGLVGSDGQTITYIGAGLVTSIGDVLESIKAKPGGDVTFPWE